MKKTIAKDCCMRLAICVDCNMNRFHGSETQQKIISSVVFFYRHINLMLIFGSFLQNNSAVLIDIFSVYGGVDL